MVDNFHCGNEFVGAWCIQICSVLEVGQGEIKCEIPGCWAWCSSCAQSYNQRGEGLWLYYEKKLSSLSNTFPILAHFKATLKNPFPSYFFWVHHSFDSFPWNEFGKTLTWSLKWFIVTWKGNARETSCKRTTHLREWNRRADDCMDDLVMNHQNQSWRVWIY